MTPEQLSFSKSAEAYQAACRSMLQRPLAREADGLGSQPGLAVATDLLALLLLQEMRDNTPSLLPYPPTEFNTKGRILFPIVLM